MKIWSVFKHENLTIGNKILLKMGENAQFHLFPQHFQYISNFRSQITYSFVKCGCSIYLFLLHSANLICRGRISRSISESPFDFEITRVDCIYMYPHSCAIFEAPTFWQICTAKTQISLREYTTHRKITAFAVRLQNHFIVKVVLTSTSSISLWESAHSDQDLRRLIMCYTVRNDSVIGALIRIRSEKVQAICTLATRICPKEHFRMAW